MKQAFQTALVSLASTIMVLVVIFTVATAIAAPTQAPPNGNPAFPLTGPAGPTGPQGPQGPQGIPGTAASLDCRMQSQSFSGTQQTVNCGSGYIATGGGFYLSDGNNNGLNWNNAWSNPTQAQNPTSWTCGRNVYGAGELSTCYVVCCRLQ